MRVLTVLGLGMGVSLFGFNLVWGQQKPAGVQSRQIVTPPGVVESVNDLPQAGAPLPGVRMTKPEAESEERLEAIKRRGLPPGDVGGKVLQAITHGGLAPIPVAPALGTNFEGFNLASSGYVPPDPHMAAGPTHLMVSVNLRFGIYSRTGSPGAAYDLDTWFKSVNTLQLGYSDPKVLYDHYAKRWIVMCIGYATTDNLRGGYFVSVSQDSTPTSLWYKWMVPVNNDSTFPDFPGVGYDSADAVYFTANHFRNDSGTFRYAGIMVLRKSELYANNPAVPPLTVSQLTGMINPQDGERTFTIKPSLAFGSPAISGTFLANTQGDSGTVVELWRLTDPVTSPALTHRATIPIGYFTAPPDAAQPGTATLINDNSSTIQAEVQYRDGKLYLAFPQAYTFGTDSDTESVIRYLELDTAGTINQNILYGADGEFFFFPAVICSNSGSVAMVFSHSSPTSYCGARYVGNFPDDLTAGVLRAGQGTYTIVAGGRNRWGDYGAIVQDPNVPRRVWMYHEYAGSTTTPPTGSKWQTRAGTILLQNHPPQIADPGPLSVNEEDTLTDTITVVEPDAEGLSSFALLSPAPGFVGFSNLGGGKGELKLTPACGAEGGYSFQLAAADNATPSLADTLDIAVTVLNHNCRPVASLSGPDTIRVNQCQSLSAGLTASDPDASGGLHFTAGTLPSFAGVTDSGNGNGSLEAAPTTADLGSYTAQVFASDGQDSSSLSVPIRVFKKGDMNQDGSLSPADVALHLNCIFLNALPPAGAGACDMDGGGPSASDVVVLLNAVFLAAPLPPC